MTRMTTAAFAAAMLLVPTLAVAQIADGSFEGASPGGPPHTAWTVAPGTFAQIEGIATPSAFLPSRGDEYLRITPGTNGNAVAHHGPHGTNVGKVSQSFVVPPHEFLAFGIDWEFIQQEATPNSTFNDFVSIDLLQPSPFGTLLVANVVFIDTGIAGAVPGYTNVPGAGAGVLTWVPNQAAFGSSSEENPAPAGFKRAWVDLTGMVSAGETLILEIVVGNGGDTAADSELQVDNARLLVTERNSSQGGLRVLGSRHIDGQGSSGDFGGDFLVETPYEIFAMPGQRLCFRARSSYEGIPWALFSGDLRNEGYYFPGVGTANLDNAQIVFDGIAPGGGDDWLGTISNTYNYLEMQVAENAPDTQIAFQGLMLTPSGANPVVLTAATEVLVGGYDFGWGQSVAPRIPLGDTLVDAANTGGPNVSGGANADSGYTLMVLGTVGFAGGSWPFYGTAATTIYVNSNGSITIDSGDADATESESEMVQDPRRRMALCWDDLDTVYGGSVDFKATSNTLTIAWENVAEDVAGIQGNWMAAQLYADGQFTFYYGGTTFDDGLVGISPGSLTYSVPPFASSDWSSTSLSYGNRGIIVPGAYRFQQFAMSYYGLMSDSCDIATIGGPGPSRIHFVPDGAGGYEFFTGTR